MTEFLNRIGWKMTSQVFKRFLASPKAPSQGLSVYTQIFRHGKKTSPKYGTLNFVRIDIEVAHNTRTKLRSPFCNWDSFFSRPNKKSLFKFDDAT